jgi:hypothetical protein
MSNPTNETKSTPSTEQATTKPKYTHVVYIYKDGEIKPEEHPAGPPFFIKDKHVEFLKAVLERPAGGKHSSKDSGRAVMLSHLICALDILGALDQVIKDKKPYIDWYYNLQLVPDNGKIDSL